MTKCKVCKAVWSHRAMLHLAVPDKARNSTTLSPPSVHRPVSQHPSLWTTPQICISSLLLFWEVLPLHKKNIPTILQKSVKCLHLRIKKVLSLQNKVIWTKNFKLCNTYHLLLSSLVHNSHKASLTLQTWSALHLCTSPPPSCHMFQRPNPHPSVLHAIMDERFGDWIKGAIVEWAAEGGIFIGPMSDHSLPMSITDSLIEDIVRNWTNWPLLIRILIKGWWIDWWWSEFEVYVALAVKAANCLQKLS